MAGKEQHSFCTIAHKDKETNLWDFCPRVSPSRTNVSSYEDPCASCQNNGLRDPAEGGDRSSWKKALRENGFSLLNGD